MNKSRHNMLDYSLTWLGVHLLFEQQFNQKLSVSYFTEKTLIPFGNGPVNKSRHYVLYFLLFLLWDHCVTKVNKIRHYLLDNSLTWLWVHLVLYQWFKHTLFVRYFTQLISGSFINSTVKKADTTCELFY